MLAHFGLRVWPFHPCLIITCVCQIYMCVRVCVCVPASVLIAAASIAYICVCG